MKNTLEFEFQFFGVLFGINQFGGEMLWIRGMCYLSNF
jgi:hypothetical protein